MGSWTLRHWAVALAVTLFVAVVIGVPTGVIPTSFYTRMTPVLWWNYPTWAAASVLEGLLAATYLRAGGTPPSANAARTGRRSAKAVVGGILSAFAVGCPVCNKLIVLAIGVSGALTYWAPAQPALAVVSVALLAYGLQRRLRAAASCPAPRAARPVPFDDYHADGDELPAGGRESRRERACGS